MYLMAQARRLIGLIDVDVALMGLLSVSVVVNVCYAYRSQTGSTVASPTGRALWAVGTIAPPLLVEDGNGNHHWLEWDKLERPLVIYVFAPGCSWCDRNSGSVQALIVQRHKRFDVIGISLSGSEPGDDSLTLADVPTYYVSSQARRAGYALGATPETIVIEKPGLVLGHWLGAYTPPLARQIEGLLGVRLSPISGS